MNPSDKVIFLKIHIQNLTFILLGSHMPCGRVTAIGGSMHPPPGPPRSSLVAQGPSVSSPLFNFGSPHLAPAPGPQVMGYSAAHSYHTQQTHKWSQRAYKGIGVLNSTPGGIVTLNLGVYEPIVDPKGRPILVQVTTQIYFYYLIQLNP